MGWEKFSGSGVHHRGRILGHYGSMISIRLAAPPFVVAIGNSLVDIESSYFIGSFVSEKPKASRIGRAAGAASIITIWSRREVACPLQRRAEAADARRSYKTVLYRRLGPTGRFPKNPTG